MKKHWLSHLGAIALSAALLLPCVLTAPAMAANDGYDPLYFWTPDANTTKLDCAQTLVNNSVPRSNFEPIVDPTEEDYGYRSNNITTFTMYTENGPVSKRFHSMYVGAYTTGGLTGENYKTEDSDSRTRTTQALEVTLAKLGEGIGSSEHEAIVLTHLMGVRTEHKEEGSMLWERDATYTVHTTLGSEWTVQGVRSWTLECPAMYKYDGEARAVIYRVTSNNLLVDTNDVTHTLAANEQIDKIVYQPYGESTSLDRNGCFHVSDVEVRGYADAAEFEAEFPASASYTDVSAETLRRIVLAEANLVAEKAWTIPEKLIGHSTETYEANETFCGPIYQKSANNPDDPDLMLSTESFLDLVDSGTYKNQTHSYTYKNDKKETVVEDRTLAPGMDCSTFVYNAISRVSTTMAYTNMLYERDNSLVRLGDLKTTDGQPKYTDADIFAAYDSDSETEKQDAFYAAYAQLQPGDVINRIRIIENGVHARLVTAVNETYDEVTCIEQTSTVDTYDWITGSENTRATTNTYSYSDLYKDGYVPYTLRQYTEQQVEDANVQIKIHPADPNNWANGVKVGVASNYRLLRVNAQLTDSTGAVLASVPDYGYRAMSEHMFLDTGAIDEKLATLPAGEYTLAVSAESGPKTTVGGTTPVTTESVTFTVDNKCAASHVDSESGAIALTEDILATGTLGTADTTTTYYLTQDITALNSITIKGTVTLCLNSHILSVNATGLTNYTFITVGEGDTLTICGGDGGGVIDGGSNTVRAISVTKGGALKLDSGTITKFNDTKSGGKASITVNGGSFTMNGGTISNNSATYGAVRFFGGASLVMKNGTITGNTAGTNGGALYHGGATGSIEINGGTISNNSGPNGAAVTIYDTSKATLTIKGGTFTGNTTGDTDGSSDIFVGGGSASITGGTFDFDPTAYLAEGYICEQDGAVWTVRPMVCPDHATGTPLTGSETELTAGTYYLTGNVQAQNLLTVKGADVTLCLNGYTLTAPSTTGDFITVSTGAKLTICGGHSGDGEINGNSANLTCIKAKMDTGATEGGDVVLKSGTITKFNSTGSGGAVVVLDATFTMDGGAIVDNDAKYGAVRLYRGVITMNGGTISGNDGTYGGAFASTAGAADAAVKIIINDGTISNNTATKGAIVHNADKSVTDIEINGGTFIGNSTTDETSSNFVKPTNVTYAINGGTFDFDPSTYVPTGCSCTQNSMGLYVVTVHTCPDHADGDALTAITADEGGTTCTLGTAGEATTYYLDKDIDAGCNIAISGDVTLCLNGKTLTAPATGDNFITVSAGATLTICGGHGGNGTIKGGTGGGRAFYLTTGSSSTDKTELTLDSGTVTGFNRSGSCAVAYLNKWTTFNMCGGTITKNSATTYGGVLYTTATGASFTMSGGTISDNKATKLGGALYMAGGSSITINDGTISNNTAGTNGGAIYVDKNTAKLTVTGGLFEGNTAGGLGGAIYREDTPTTGFSTITGGTFINNEAKGDYNHTLRFGAATQVSGVTVIEGSYSEIGNSNCQIIGGKFNVDPTTRLSSTEPLTVKAIDETITVNGETYTLTHEVVKGYRYEDAFIDFGSSLGFTLYLKADNAYATVDGFETALSGADEDVTVTLTASANLPGIVELTAHGIAAKEMRDAITFTVTKDDVTYFKKTISIYDAVKAWYDAAADGVYKTMLADMLNYGRAAQDAFNYNETAMGDELTGSSEVTAWVPTKGAGVDNEAYADKVAVSLSLKERIELNIYVDDPDATVTSATFTPDGGTATDLFAATEASANDYAVEDALTTAGDTITRIRFYNISVKNVKGTVDVAVTLSGEAGSFKVKYSIEDYVVNALGGDQNDLLVALQKYVDSAAAYLP